jgi:hypothetical protein
MKKFFVFHEVKTGGGTSGGPSVGFPEVEKTDICLQVSHTQYQDVCEKKRNDEVLGTKAFLVGDRMCSNVMPYKIKFMESILAKHNHVKILIHSNFLKNGLQVVKASLDKLGRKSVAIVGNMTEKERSLNFLTFCDPHSGVDICLTSAAGSQVR